MKFSVNSIFKRYGVTIQQKILKSMTKKEIDVLAKKQIQPDILNIVLVGDKADILPDLQKPDYKIVELDADGKKIEKKGF